MSSIQLRVVRGDPSDEELAAVVAVLASRAAAGSARLRPPVARSQWSNRARNVRPPLSTGPGAWRASGLPR